jgi:ABC-type uncharacterized transport system fused permease/ATPase subunit
VQSNRSYSKEFVELTGRRSRAESDYYHVLSRMQ